MLASRNTLLFDLDGTLIHTKPGIIQGFAYAFDKLKKTGHELDVPQDLDFESVIGPPLTESFRRFVKTEPEVELAVRYYRELYLDTGWTMSRPFDGIADALKALRAGGKRLLVATSKMEKLACDTLAYHGLDGCFDVIAGASEDDKRSRKQDIIERALALSGADRADGIMIGDRMHDMEGAAAAGLCAVGVLWGYGSRRELEAYRPLFLAQTPRQLSDTLLGAAV